MLRMRVRFRSCQSGTLQVQLRDEVVHAVVGERGRAGVKRVGRDDVGAGFQELAMDGGDMLGLSDRQQIVVALERGRPGGESLSSEVLLR